MVMKLIEINGKNEPAWRCQSLSSSIATFRRVRPGEWATRTRLETSFSSGPHYYLEVVLTDRILVCWTDSRVEASDVAGINTTAKIIQMKDGGAVVCRITDRRPTQKENDFIQHERLIESNNAIAAGLAALTRPSGSTESKTSPSHGTSQ